MLVTLQELNILLVLIGSIISTVWTRVDNPFHMSRLLLPNTQIVENIGASLS